jgi:hydroxymethylglutaryl-CoA reductase (NADPH)
MNLIFKAALKQLYTRNSLRNTDDGFRFELKNRLMDAKLTGVRRVAVDGRDVALDGAHLVLPDGRAVTPDEVSAAAPLEFELGDVFDVRLRADRLAPGAHAIEIAFDSQPFGALTLDVEDVVPD